MKKGFFYLIIAVVVGGALAAPSVCAQARETAEESTEEVSSSLEAELIELPEPRQREDFWEHFEQEVFEAAKGEQDKEKAWQILRYGEKLIELNQENKFACSAANRLVVSLFFLGRLEDALRLADMALSLPETEHGDHMVARHHKSLCYMELGDHQAAQEAAAEALASDGPEEWAEDIRNAAVNKEAMRQKIEKAAELLQWGEGTKEERAEAEAILMQATKAKGKYLESLYLNNPNIPPGDSLIGLKGSLVDPLVESMLKDGRIAEAREVALAFIHENPCDPMASSIAHDMCNLTGKDFGAGLEEWKEWTAELEEWVAFFEEKGCGEWAGVAHIRIDLQTAYTMVGDHLQDGSEEQEAMLRKALALAEELKKFKKHPEDPVPWSEEGSQRAVKDSAEMVRGLVDEAKEERLEREEQERHAKRMQIIGTALLVVSGVIGFWAVLRQERRIKKQTSPE